MKTILLFAACAAALMGCAQTETAVRVNCTRAFGTGMHTYAFAGDPASPSDAEDERYASAIAHRLAELGYTAAPAKAARYRIALSYATRPASVGVAYPSCAGGPPCGETALPAGFVWPGAQTYIHSLTLRFFDRADGSEPYSISVTKRDREPDSTHDIDYLVTGALARLPFATATRSDDGDRGKLATSATSADCDGHADWKVTFLKGGTDATPRVARMTSLPH
ncbi:DUF4136 domain-containing protein [Trinickia acidisoli]|uniref:DUF4136 domain-containing protein n=1 Tax=Trinickia acidisoli TaxID=2767482 RepID=UPI001A8F443D|nr:DUF4136 domain-containing protein [Trinickia acidisoli]